MDWRFGSLAQNSIAKIDTELDMSKGQDDDDDGGGGGGGMPQTRSSGRRPPCLLWNEICLE